jgi:hypothetical protein
VLCGEGVKMAVSNNLCQIALFDGSLDMNWILPEPEIEVARDAKRRPICLTAEWEEKSAWAFLSLAEGSSMLLV